MDRWLDGWIVETYIPGTGLGWARICAAIARAIARCIRSGPATGQTHRALEWTEVEDLAGGSGDLTTGAGCISSGPTTGQADSSETSGLGSARSCGAAMFLVGSVDLSGHGMAQSCGVGSVPSRRQRRLVGEAGCINSGPMADQAGSSKTSGRGRPRFWSVAAAN